MQEEKKRMQVNQDMTDKTQNQEKVQMTIIKQSSWLMKTKILKHKTQQDLNHNGNMIDKQTNNKEERGIDMRKETTNKPKKEPF